MTEIEFSILIKEWLLDVGLDYVGSEAAVVVYFFVFYVVFYLFEVFTVFYVSAAVAKLTGFDDPAIQSFFPFFIVLS
jgi:hypothetical protein